MEKQMTIPKLRFPEFKGEWKMEFGNKLFDPISNKIHNSDLPILAISQEFGAVPREMINYQISVSEKSIDGYKVIEKGDFIISLRSFQGGIEYSNYKGICSPAYIILRSKIEINDHFYKIYFKSNNYIQALCSKLEGIRDGKMISYKYFSEIALPFPTLSEQKRIASFFTVLDKKIAQLKTKKQLLQQYKKGVMQQLFSQTLRFKDENGKAFPKWEKKKLGEVAKITTGSTPSTVIEEYYNGNKLFVSPADLQGNRFINKTKTTLTELGFSKGRLISKGSILFVCIGSTIGKVAIANDDCLTNQQINSLTANIKYSNDFIFSLLELNASEIKLMAGVQAVPQINKTDFSNLKYKFPCFAEQTKIANFLSSIDEKINRTETQIQQTQAYKKGLLQNMFI